MEATRYNVILADPPWPERGGGRIQRGADRHYRLMRTREIEALGEQVQGWAAADCFLFLWVTNNHLPDGLQVMRAWGFRYVSNLAWVKPTLGLGHYFRMQHELCFLGVRGRPPYSRRPRGSAAGRVVHPSVVFADRREHSRKPDAVIDIIETFSPGPYLEMFSRYPRLGWDVMGDEVGVLL